QVGAQVGDDPGPHAGDLAVGRGGDLDLVDLVAPVDRGLHVLAPRLDVLDGPAETQSQRGGDHLVGIDVELGPEAAAHIGGDHADLGLRHAEDQAELDLEQVR